jgi:XTP/dITP diphosphohydrolase
MQKILLATTNPTKQRYLAWLVEGLGFETCSLDTLGDIPEPTEKDATPRENAETKALHYACFSDDLVLSSDGGLSIPALGERWNPVRTHRFAGPQASDRDRVKALLKLMADYHGDERTAYFTESIAFASKGEIFFSATVDSEACLLDEDYDEKSFIEDFWLLNLFRYSALQKRFSELNEKERIASSEMWQALKKKLQQFFRNSAV